MSNAKKNQHRATRGHSAALDDTEDDPGDPPGPHYQSSHQDMRRSARHPSRGALPLPSRSCEEPSPGNPIRPFSMRLSHSGDRSKTYQGRLDDLKLFSDPLIENETQYGPFNDLRTRYGRYRRAYKHGYITWDDYRCVLEDTYDQAKRCYHSDKHLQREIYRVVKRGKVQFHVSFATSPIPIEYRKPVDISTRLASFSQNPTSDTVTTAAKLEAFIASLGVSGWRYSELLMTRSLERNTGDIQKVEGKPSSELELSATRTTSQPPPDQLLQAAMAPGADSIGASPNTTKQVVEGKMSSRPLVSACWGALSDPTIGTSECRAIGNGSTLNGKFIGETSPALVSRPRIRCTNVPDPPGARGTPSPFIWTSQRFTPSFTHSSRILHCIRYWNPPSF